MIRSVIPEKAEGFRNNNLFSGIDDKDSQESRSPNIFQATQVFAHV